MIVKSQKELEGLKEAANAVAVTLVKMKEFAKVGISTKELDDYGGEILASFGAISAPIKDYGFPGYNCISLNNEACHGVPSANKILKEGDLLNIDVSAELNGFYGDNGASFVIGEDINNFMPLVRASNDVLNIAISAIKKDVKICKIGWLIQSEARKRGFQVIHNLFGHGIGRKLHEEPQRVPCFMDNSIKERFQKNSVVAIETFISTKAVYLYEMEDGWTLRAKDNSFVAQHEHTIMVTDNEPLILTYANGNG